MCLFWHSLLRNPIYSMLGNLGPFAADNPLALDNWFALSCGLLRLIIKLLLLPQLISRIFIYFYPGFARLLRIWLKNLRLRILKKIIHFTIGINTIFKEFFVVDWVTSFAMFVFYLSLSWGWRWKGLRVGKLCF